MYYIIRLYYIRSYRIIPYYTILCYVILGGRLRRRGDGGEAPAGARRAPGRHRII